MNIHVTWLSRSTPRITNAPYEDILGLAFATNAVTVNTGTADRKVEYFHREIAVTNGSGPCWQNVCQFGRHGDQRRVGVSGQLAGAHVTLLNAGIFNSLIGRCS